MGPSCGSNSAAIEPSGRRQLFRLVLERDTTLRFTRKVVPRFRRVPPLNEHGLNTCQFQSANFAACDQVLFRELSAFVFELTAIELCRRQTHCRLPTKRKYSSYMLDEQLHP